MAKEGELKTPIRHPIPWQSEDFYDAEALDKETRRVFDICHGCRRCFYLCDTFPQLFNLIDESESGELDTVDSKNFKAVTDACTLCDMCFTAKCPYVPPHEFNLDFPHLMVRHRAVQLKNKQSKASHKRIIATDRNGKLGIGLGPLARAATQSGSLLRKTLVDPIMGTHPRAKLPPIPKQTLTRQASLTGTSKSTRKALIYASCLPNYHQPEIGLAAQRVLNLNGVQTDVSYVECCGMPQLEHGDLADVARRAQSIAEHLLPFIEEGWDIISLVPSCSLMLKSEWPLIIPDDPNIKKLATSTRDISEYIIEVVGKKGLAGKPPSPAQHVILQLACHARALNIGRKGAELLGLLADLEVTIVERCSGHGGSWGAQKEHFETAVLLAKPVIQEVVSSNADYVSSECPLSATHIAQVLDEDTNSTNTKPLAHPVLLLDMAYQQAH